MAFWLEMVNATINFAIATGRLDYDRDKKNEETCSVEVEVEDTKLQSTRSPHTALNLAKS